MLLTADKNQTITVVTDILEAKAYPKAAKFTSKSFIEFMSSHTSTTQIIPLILAVYYSDMNIK